MKACARCGLIAALFFFFTGCPLGDELIERKFQGTFVNNVNGLVAEIGPSWVKFSDGTFVTGDRNIRETCVIVSAGQQNVEGYNGERYVLKDKDGIFAVYSNTSLITIYGLDHFFIRK